MNFRFRRRIIRRFDGRCQEGFTRRHGAGSTESRTSRSPRSPADDGRRRPARRCLGDRGVVRHQRAGRRCVGPETQRADPRRRRRARVPPQPRRPGRCGRGGAGRSDSSPTRSPSRHRAASRSRRSTTSPSSTAASCSSSTPHASRRCSTSGRRPARPAGRRHRARRHGHEAGDRARVAAPHADRAGQLLRQRRRGCRASCPTRSHGGRAAAELVLAAGHRDVAFITGGARSWATQQRNKGYLAALPRRLASATTTARVLEGNFRADSGYELTRRLLARRRRPTAIVCGNDLMALGAYFAINEARAAHPRRHLRRRLRRPRGSGVGHPAGTVDGAHAVLRDGPAGGRAPPRRNRGHAAAADLRPVPRRAAGVRRAARKRMTH